jgi:spore maturation protein B
MSKIITLISDGAMPAIIFVIVLYAIKKGVGIFDAFVEGAKEGITNTVRIIPSLVGLFMAISVFRASGGLDLIIYAFKPIGNLIGIPKEVMPLMFMRPLSGSASLAIVVDILKQYGPDSLIGKIASTMMGSTETIFYTMAVYFGAVGIKNSRHTLVCALIADFVAVIAACTLCRYIL